MGTPMAFNCSCFKSNIRHPITPQLWQSDNLVGLKCRKVLPHTHHLLQKISEAFSIVVSILIALATVGKLDFHLLHSFEKNFIVLGHLCGIACIVYVILFSLPAGALTLFFFSTLCPYFSSAWYSSSSLFFNFSSSFSLSNLIFSNSRIYLSHFLPFFMYLPLISCSRHDCIRSNSYIFLISAPLSFCI